MVNGIVFKDDWLQIIIARARHDLLKNELRPAKDRLRTILRMSPHCQPALELMGQVYFRTGDYRNAIQYWAQADYWKEPMDEACERIFKTVEKALARGNLRLAGYCLTAFAGTRPPPSTAKRLRLLQAAYYKLDVKNRKLMGLAWAPVAGGCLLLGIVVTSALFDEEWESSGWLAIVAIGTTIIVALVNFAAYVHAALSYRRTLSAARRSKS